MSKPAGKTLIGIFVLGAISLLVIAVVVLGSGKFFKKSFPVVCYFEGSVGGLNVGAPVVLRGAKVGTVTSVKLRFDSKSDEIQIPVFSEIEPERLETKDRSDRIDPIAALRLLIGRGLRARLEPQSLLTGQMQVALDFYPERPARFVGADPGYPEIPTIPTPLQELAKRIEQLPLEQIVKDIGSAVAGINRVVNSPEITKTIHFVSLSAEEAKSLIQNLNSQVQPLSSDVQQTLREAQKLLREIDAKATTLTSSIDGTVKDVQKLAQNIDRQVDLLGPSIQRTVSSIEKTSDEAGMTFRQAQQTLVVLEGDIGEDSELMYELKKAIKDVGAAGKAIESLARSAERHPESIIFGKKKK
jgi:paraquat-inducible protein B